MKKFQKAVCLNAPAPTTWANGFLADNFLMGLQVPISPNEVIFFEERGKDVVYGHEPYDFAMVYKTTTENFKKYTKIL